MLKAECDLTGLRGSSTSRMLRFSKGMMPRGSLSCEWKKARLQGKNGTGAARKGASRARKLTQAIRNDGAPQARIVTAWSRPTSLTSRAFQTFRSTNESIHGSTSIRPLTASIRILFTTTIPAYFSVEIENNEDFFFFFLLFPILSQVKSSAVEKSFK